MQDKYKAIWLSYSSMNDFQKCHRLYYLKNMFKDPRTKRKINIVSPYLTLGSTVHKVIEDLKNVETKSRRIIIQNNILNNFETEWSKYDLKNGGFKNEAEKEEFHQRGIHILKNVIDHPRYLLNKIIPQKYFYSGDMIPNYYLDEENNLILCGSIDWIEYLEEDGKVRIIDFKTGRNDENDNSWQLPIYYLLFNNLQKENKVKKEFQVKELAYWYLDQENKKAGNAHEEFEIKEITESELAKIAQAKGEILQIGKEIKKFRESGKFHCNNETSKGEGCQHCREYEEIYKFLQKGITEQNNETRSIQLDEENKKDSDVEYVGVSDYNQDLYLVK